LVGCNIGGDRFLLATVVQSSGQKGTNAVSNPENKRPKRHKCGFQSRKQERGHEHASTPNENSLRAVCVHYGNERSGMGERAP